MGSILVTPPAAEPIALADAKLHLRVTTSSEDSLITSYIKAARVLCENYSQKAFVTQTWKLFLDGWPRSSKRDTWWDGVREGSINDLFLVKRDLELPRAPLVSVTHIKVYDAAEVATTLDSDTYGVDSSSNPGRIYLQSGQTWPTVGRPSNGIEIQYVAGYGSASDVPDDIKTAILMLIAHLYENRGDVDTELPTTVQALLGAHVKVRL